MNKYLYSILILLCSFAYTTDTEQSVLVYDQLVVTDVSATLLEHSNALPIPTQTYVASYVIIVDYLTYSIDVWKFSHYAQPLDILTILFDELDVRETEVYFLRDAKMVAYVNAASDNTDIWDLVGDKKHQFSFTYENN